MLPEVLLLTLGDSTALLVANLDYLRQNLVKLLYVLVRSFLVREGHIEERVHNVRSQVNQHLHIELDSLEIVLVSLVQHGTGLLGALFLANAQTFVDGEVAARDVVHNLRAILLVAQDLHKLKQQVNILLTRPIASHCAAVLALLNNPLLVLLQHRVEELVREVFLVLERPRNRVIVPVEPLIAKFHGLLWVHLHKIRDVQLNQLFHLLQGHPIWYSLLFEKAILGIVLLLFII